MKKLLLIIVLIATMQTSLFSQSIGQGKSVFYVGAGLGYAGGAKYKGLGYTYFSTPPINLGFEHGISEKIPQSVIGLGGALSVNFGRASYRDHWGYGWDSRWTDMRVLFKGYYHHKFLVGEKWDVYAAVVAGIRYRFWSWTNYDPYNPYIVPDEGGVYPAGGIAVGGRYYVGKTFGFYAEVGEGLNVDYAQIGFAFKF